MPADQKRSEKDQSKKRTPAPTKARSGRPTPSGIDSRNESIRRYGHLEPEGYTRHSHGNREGEFQAGGKQPTELPIEESAPMTQSRYRKERKGEP